jgi:hypothetical protein
MCRFCGNWVIVDWRPYELPEVYGPFHSKRIAFDAAARIFELDLKNNPLLPDGIVVRELQNDWTQD